MNMKNDSPHTSALRKGRYSESGRIYLLTSVIHQRRPLLSALHPARLVISEMRSLHDKGLLHSLAWVLMPDHLHWLVKLHSLPLDMVMRLFRSRTALQLNQQLGCNGQVWQRGYHDHALRRDEDLLACARYIVANPLRAGLVKRVGDWPHWDAEWL